MAKFTKLDQANRLLAIAKELLQDTGEFGLADKVVDVIDDVHGAMYDLEHEAAVLDN